MTELTPSRMSSFQCDLEDRALASMIVAAIAPEVRTILLDALVDYYIAHDPRALLRWLDARWIEVEEAAVAGRR
jgi:hypothetical protein